jgi:hypothetical protein
MPFLATLTDTQLFRLWNRILTRIDLFFSGGGLYGVDMPTLCAVNPPLARAYLMIRAECRRRNDS